MRRVKRGIALVLAWGIVLLCLSPMAAALSPTSSLTVSVGYYGMPFYEKRVFSLSELEGLDTFYATYTALDNGGFARYASAYGVRLSSVLDAAGIDLASVNRCHFLTSDNPSGYGHTSLPAWTLFQTRYAFPALSEYFGQPEGEAELRITDYDAVWASAVQVDTMLAIYDNMARVDSFAPYDPSNYGYVYDRCLRLLFGQTQPDEVIAGNLAYTVTGIKVEFSGAPTVQMQESDLKLTVGADYRVAVDVTAADELIADALRAGLRWESSDPSIVSVDADGQLTVKQEGEAVIRVFSEEYELSSTLHISVGAAEGNGNGGGDGQGEGNGNGNGNGNGDGNGSENGRQETVTPTQPNPAASEGASEEHVTPQPDENVNGGELSAPTEEATEPLHLQPQPPDTTAAPRVTLRGKPIRVGGSDNGSAAPSNGGSEGAPLGLLVKKNPLVLPLSLLGAALLLLGAAWSARRYKKEK